MQIKQLLTYSFTKNVGSKDRLFRMLSGIALIALPWILQAPLGLSIAASVFGVAWFATGLSSRCGAYYLCGCSTTKS